MGKHILSALLMLTSLNLWAQPGSETMMARLSSELELTEAQQQQMQPVMANFSEQLQQLRSSDDSRREKGKKLRQAAEERDQQLQTILDEQQFAEFQQLMAELRQQMKQGKSR